MRRLRWTGSVVLAIVCLLVVAAPVAMAGGGSPRVTGTAAVGGVADWAAGWVGRVGAWLGWGQGGRAPIVAPAVGDCGGVIDPNGVCRPTVPLPQTDGDCGGVIDPNGAPCKP